MAKLHLAQQLIDILWPVGSVYISTDAANPSTKFGGTWSQIGQNVNANVYGKFTFSARDI